MKNKSNLYIIILMLLSALLFGVFYFLGHSGEYVLITINTKEYGTYKLNEDQTIRVDLDDGEYNIVEIKDGKVDVIESSCDNQICVYDYPLESGDSRIIVCLPHALIIEIKK